MKKIVKSSLMLFVLGYWLSGFVCLAETIHDAIHKGDEEKVKSGLSEGADINEKDKAGYTPLHKAIIINEFDLAKFLVENGADLQTPHEHGDTPLHFAVSGSHRENLIEFVKLLLSRGIDVNAKNKDGVTPLQVAVVNGNAPLVSLLLEHGAKVDVPYPDGVTVIDRAADEGYGKIVTLLQKSGAQRHAAKGQEPTSPRVLFRRMEEKQVGVDGAILLRKLKDSLNEEHSTLSKKLSFVKACPAEVYEDYKIIRKNQEGKVLDVFERFYREPEFFQFVVQESSYSEEVAKHSSQDPVEIDVRETWEIYKVANPTNKKIWESSYVLKPSHNNGTVLMEDENVGPKLAEEVVAPKRGPIIQGICDFLHQSR